MIVKVCGMRDADNIRAVEQLGVDWMGFIFWPKSSRYVSEKPAYLPTRCKRVGVFVDADIETVKQTADDYALDLIQLHGHESPECVRALRAAFIEINSVPLDKAPCFAKHTLCSQLRGSGKGFAALTDTGVSDKGENA